MSEEITNLVQKLVQTDSTKGKSIAAAEILANFLEEHGLDVKLDNYKEGEGNVLTRIGPSNSKAFLLSGHLDTVPIGNIKNWTHDPFSGKIINNELWGRGSVDMKGGIGAITGALIDLIKNESELTHQIILAASSEEETGLYGARHFVKQNIMNNVEYLLVAEPTGLGVAIMEKGIMWLKINAKGKQAHGSRPDLGINAIEGLAKIIPDFYSVLPDTYIDEVGKTSLNIGMINGGTAPNVVPEEAHLICDIRTTPGVENNSIITGLNDLITKASSNDLKFSQEVLESQEAVISPNKKLGEVLADFTYEYTQKRPKLSGMYYATDGAAFMESKQASFAIYGPGSTELLHQTNERLNLNELDLSQKIIKNTILKLNS